MQGVGYRAWVEHQAIARDLEGWVRNRRDGSVEAVFAGPADIVSEMIAACRRGPSMARVDAVQEEAGNPDTLNLRQAGERSRCCRRCRMSGSLAGAATDEVIE